MSIPTKIDSQAFLYKLKQSYFYCRCKFCGQQFAQITAMKIHVRLHTGEKPYSCTLCPRRFVSRGYLQTHLKKHNPKQTADDQLFGNGGFNETIVS